jgi:hypothetical protein
VKDVYHFYRFDSWPEAIESHAVYLHRHYVFGGYSTIKAFACEYLLGEHIKPKDHEPLEVYEKKLETCMNHRDSAGHPAGEWRDDVSNLYGEVFKPSLVRQLADLTYYPPSRDPRCGKEIAQVTIPTHSDTRIANHAKDHAHPTSQSSRGPAITLRKFIPPPPSTLPEPLLPLPAEVNLSPQVPPGAGPWGGAPLLTTGSMRILQQPPPPPPPRRRIFFVRLLSAVWARIKRML